VAEQFPRGLAKPPAVVYIFHARNTIPRNIYAALAEVDLPIVHVQDPWQWPRESDLYVQQTALSNASRVAAALIKAEQIVLPQGSDYLARRVQQLAALGDVYIYTPHKVGAQPIFHQL
jgi:hypothetical protein